MTTCGDNTSKLCTYYIPAHIQRDIYEFPLVDVNEIHKKNVLEKTSMDRKGVKTPIFTL